MLLIPFSSHWHALFSWLPRCQQHVRLGTWDFVLISHKFTAPVDAPNNFVIGFTIATNTTILTWSAPDNANGLTGCVKVQKYLILLMLWQLPCLLRPICCHFHDCIPFSINILIHYCQPTLRYYLSTRCRLQLCYSEPVHITCHSSFVFNMISRYILTC